MVSASPPNVHNVSPSLQVVARRFDGLGGRLTALANAIAIGRIANVQPALAWLDSEDLFSNDPSELFSDPFLDRYLIEPSSLEGRVALEFLTFDELHEISQQHRNRDGSSSAYVVVDVPIGLHPALAGLGSEGRRAFVDAFESIEFTDPLEGVRKEVTPSLARSRATGFHWRAGDVGSGPWRRAMWHQKYQPSPVAELVVAQLVAEGTEVIVVSDDIEQAERLARRVHGVRVSSDLVSDVDQLTPLQFAAADLLVLSGCQRIIGPPHSAFSTLAALQTETDVEVLSDHVNPGQLEQLLASSLAASPECESREGRIVAHDLIWFSDLLDQTLPPAILLDACRRACTLDSEFTAAWARRARLAARLGQLQEARMAFERARVTAALDDRQEDSAVDADLADAVVASLSLLWSARGRRRRQELVDVAESALARCQARRPHRPPDAAIEGAQQLLSLVRRRTQGRIRLPLLRRLRRQLLLAPPWTQPLDPEIKHGSRDYDPVANSIEGIYRILNDVE